MNRMIRLFQQKADTALTRLLIERKRQVPIGDDMALKLKESVLLMLTAEHKTWSRAAELLRKEELNK